MNKEDHRKNILKNKRGVKEKAQEADSKARIKHRNYRKKIKRISNVIDEK